MTRIGVMVAMAMPITSFTCAGVAGAGVIADRQVNQQQRILNGVGNGELTRGETRVLEREQAKIQGTKRGSWSDGKLSLRERARLDRMHDKASADIYRLKHNGFAR